MIPIKVTFRDPARSKPQTRELFKLTAADIAPLLAQNNTVLCERIRKHIKSMQLPDSHRVLAIRVGTRQLGSDIAIEQVYRCESQGVSASSL